MLFIQEQKDRRRQDFVINLQIVNISHLDEYSSCVYLICSKHFPVFSEVTLGSYTMVVEQCQDTGLFVGNVQGIQGAHSQGESLDELSKNMVEVFEMIHEDGAPVIESVST